MSTPRSLKSQEGSRQDPQFDQSVFKIFGVFKKDGLKTDGPGLTDKVGTVIRIKDFALAYPQFFDGLAIDLHMGFSMAHLIRKKNPVKNLQVGGKLP